MTDGIHFVIEPECLAGIGQLISGDKTRVSPFQYGATEKLTDIHQDKLQQSGVLDAGGQIVSNLRPTLELLASTRAYTRIRLSPGAELLEYNVYFAPDGSRAVSITSTDKGLVVQDPAPTEEFIEGLRAYTGGSIIRACDFDEEMRVEEALTLAALIDLRRQSVLRAFVDKTLSAQESYDAHAIYEAIANTPSSSQWLVAIIQDMVESEIPLSETTIERTLTDLATSNHVVKTGEQYMLGEVESILGSRFLVFDNIMVLWSGRERDDGEIFNVGFTCLQAGVHELLFLDASGGRFQFTTLSSEALLEYVRHFLQDPEALREMAEETSREEESPRAFCPNCGIEVSPEDRFCRKCGKSLH